MFIWIAALARKIRESREGAVAIQMALIFTALIGMGALASEIGFALYKHRQMQSAADAAAYGAAIAKSTGYPTTIATEAYADAAAVGFVNGANGVTIAVNNPPTSGPNTANMSAIEVIITQPQTLTVVGAVNSLTGSANPSGLFNLGVRAVATAGGGGGSCAAQLLPNQNPGVTISNGATVTMISCGMAVCSTGNTALSMSGGTNLNLCDTASCSPFSTKLTVSVAGKASVTNGAQINGQQSCTSPTCKASQGTCAANVNPYASVTMPTMPGGCSLGTGTSYGYNKNVQTISPGTWCNGVTFGSSAQIKLNPGVYYVNGGNFSVGGAVQMTGTGVTIIFTGSGSNYAYATIGNGATVTLAAPTTGTTQGIAFFGDPNAPASTTSSFGGGASMNITGAIYFPSNTVQFQNGITNPSGCTQLIAGIIQFQGGAQFSNNCAGTGTSAIGGGPTTLVE
jgi:Flp pilus assembly protein TadG